VLDAEQQHYDFLGSLTAPRKKELSFANRVGIAAGFDKNGDYIDELCALAPGFVEIGSVTLRPQDGNPKPRVWRYQDQNSIVNRMGMPNKGIDYALERIYQARKKTSIGLSIAANTVEDYATCLERAAPFVDYVAINISCPNVEHGQSFQEPHKLRELLESLGPYRHVPIAVKISPDLQRRELVNIVDLLNEFNVEGAICSNLTHNHDFLTVGGASGSAAKKASMRTVSRMAKMFTGKIIASGGILTADDAWDYFYNGPQLIEDIKRCVP
jgi:dihydroorotate dehydrogenase